jgi:hypothetical protein
MNIHFVPRDERTTAVEHASYRWAYLILAYGVLLSVAYRGFVMAQSSWDLLALVVLSGAVSTVYQSMHRVLSRQWLVVALLTMLGAAVVAAALVWLW